MVRSRLPNLAHRLRPLMETKDCPMCGEVMRLVDRETVDRIPGTSEVKRRKITEWVCPDCDYFEEADADELG